MTTHLALFMRNYDKGICANLN